MIIVSGSSNPKLGKSLGQLLDSPLAEVEISKFPNGEKRIWVKSGLKGRDVLIVQSFSHPVDEHIIEFTLLVDAARHLGAKKIIAIIPWLGYSPQDKEFRKGEPVSVHVIARIIESIGITELVTVEIHSLKSLKFFTVPVHHVATLPLFVDYFSGQDLHHHIVISLDKGARSEAQKLSQKLHLPLCVFDKVRDRHTGEVTLTHLSGDVQGKHGIAIDDFVSTGATRIAASRILKSMGLLTYTDCITHAILAGDSHHKLQQSQVDRLLVTDTYPIPSQKYIAKLTQLSAAPLIASTVNALHLS